MKPISAVLVGFCISLSGCAGGRFQIVARHLDKPVSLSEKVFNPEMKIVSEKSGLTKLAHFSNKVGRCNVLFTAIPLSGYEKDISDYLNRTVEEHQGDAVINLKVTRIDHTTNMLGIIFFFVPLIPSCVSAQIEGDIVKFDK